MSHPNKHFLSIYRLFIISCLLFVLIIVLTGCGGGTTQTTNQVSPTPSSQSSIQTLAITAVDYGYVMPVTLHIQPGLLNLALINNGSESHQAQVARLNNGITSASVYNELVTKMNQVAAFSLLTFVGGPDTIAPGYGQETTLNLPGGEYVLLCFVVGQDGIPHTSKGMIHFFRVADGPPSSATPLADAEITMKDFSYALPPVMTQDRPLTLQVTNQGSEPHELNIVKLAQGKTVQDVSTFFHAPSGPPPFEEMGGLATLAAAGSGWIKLHLDAGNYAAFSYIPDQSTGKSQISLGMITAFTVQ